MRADLYRFDDNGVISTFTSGNRRITYNSEVYVPIAVGRGDILIHSSMEKQTVEVKISIKNSVVKSWLTSPSIFAMTLSIFTQIDTNTVEVAWRGRIVSKSVTNREMTMKADSNFSVLQRSGLRKRFQRTCPHALYAKGCGINKNSFSRSGNISVKSGLELTVAEAALEINGYYSGGIVEDSAGRYHFIVSHNGSAITLLKDAEIPIDTCTLYAGCDRSTSTCTNKFNNLNNFGGFPYIPITNPFGGTKVF